MDLYALLGVTRAASPGEIERAYRRLARRYHPGINPGDRAAAEMFRQVHYAFGVLCDAERRRDYDRGAASSPPEAEAAVSVELQGFDFSVAAHGAQAATFAELFADVFQQAAREAISPTRGADIDVALQVSFRDAVRGGTFPMSLMRHDRCASCGGDGRVQRAPMICPACGGQGSRRWARGHMVFTRPCDDCGATGHIATQTCRGCAGAGIQPRSEVVSVSIPAGINSGDRIAVPGRGQAGARGGPAGDLYVTIAVESHPYFTRAGRDLHLTLPLAVHEAALGARVDVPTLEEPVKLRIPPGTPSGKKFRIPGAGVPAPAGASADEAGDLIAEAQIVLPPVRDERSKELLREFAALNSQEVRKW